MFQLLVPVVLGIIGGKLLCSSKKYEAGGGIDEWRKGSSIKFRTRKEAQERVRLLKNYPNEYRNIRIDKLNYGDKFNDGYFVLFEYLKKGDKYEAGGDILDMDTLGRIESPDFADASMYAKGGKIDDSKISTGNRFGLPNGEIIKIEKRYLDSKYSGDDRIVEYTRTIDGNETKQESTVKSLRIFLNNWGAVLIDKHLEKSIGDRYWTKFYKGGRICPVGTEIQTLIFDKDKFDKKSAKEWAKKHDFKYGFVDEKEETLRIRQQNPSSFRKDTFRTIDITKGVQAVIACPKKNYAEGGDIDYDKIISLYDVTEDSKGEIMGLVSQSLYSEDKLKKYQERAAVKTSEYLDKGDYLHRQEVYVHPKNAKAPYLNKYKTHFILNQ